MDGIFECIVARKTPAYAWPAKIGMSLFLTITILATLIINPIFFVLTIGFGVFMYIIMPRFDLEWEYTFLDGELRIDKIFSQSSRKRFLVLLFAWRYTLAVGSGESRLTTTLITIHHIQKRPCQGCEAPPRAARP